MTPKTKFVHYLLDFYEDEGMTFTEAIRYTQMYIKLFPNLWSDGDSLDREKVYELFLMGRANALAKKHNDTDLQNLITEITQ